MCAYPIATVCFEDLKWGILDTEGFCPTLFVASSLSPLLREGWSSIMPGYTMDDVDNLDLTMYNEDLVAACRQEEKEGGRAHH